MRTIYIGPILTFYSAVEIGGCFSGTLCNTGETNEYTTIATAIEAKYLKAIRKRAFRKRNGISVQQRPRGCVFMRRIWCLCVRRPAGEVASCVTVGRTRTGASSGPPPSPAPPSVEAVGTQ